MAIDTRAKRFAALNFRRVGRGLVGDPNTSGIDQAERQMVSKFYSGILAGPPVPPVTGVLQFGLAHPLTKALSRDLARSITENRRVDNKSDLC